MPNVRDSLFVRVVLIASVILTLTLPAATQSANVFLKVSDESAPRGAIVQMKLFVTEPTPISTGFGDLPFEALDAIAGIAMMSPGDDTLGVAVVGATGIHVAVASSNATFGMSSERPVVTVSGRVPMQMSDGSIIQFNLDPSALDLRNASGGLYPVVVEAGGSLRAAQGLSIGDVRPGSAELPAGSVVTIYGTGFLCDTEIRLGEARVSPSRYISSSQIEVVLPAPARMHGMRIRARNRRGSWAIYYSYQRTYQTVASQHAVLRHAMPLFPPSSSLNATVDLAGASAGLAIQNIHAQTAAVTADLLTANGQRLASVQLYVPANQFIVREISELFQMGYSPSFIVRVSATKPIQVMGISVNAAGDATPLRPR